MHFDAARGGVDRYFHGLLSGFDANATPYLAAAFGSPQEAAPPPGARVPLGPPELSLLARWGLLRRFGREAMAAQPRVLATHFALYAVPLLPLRVPHVIHFHGPWAGEAAAEGASPWVVAAKRALERRVYRTGARFIVLSDAFRTLLEERYGVDPERVRVIPGGVDAERFRPVADRAQARHTLGWPEGRRIILCVRRLARRMGLEELLEAWEQVTPRHPEALLVIGGRGPLAGELESAVARIGSSVRLHGFIPEEVLPLAYAAADATLVPSQVLEGFGLVTLESLACGTPVLVTPVGGLPEAVAGLGLTLAGGDVESLAGGLERALSGSLPSADTCRAHAMRFAWPEIARRVCAVYQEVAG